MLRIPTRLHGAIDLLLGLGLAALALLSEAPLAIQNLVPLLAGGALILNALLTDFEWGLLRVVQIPVHLWLDGLIALFLIVSPWLLAFDHIVWSPHVAVGSLLAVIAFLTHTIPSFERRGSSRNGAG